METEITLSTLGILSFFLWDFGLAVLLSICRDWEFDLHYMVCKLVILDSLVLEKAVDWGGNGFQWFFYFCEWCRNLLIEKCNPSKAPESI